jgi:hypothetical protein
MSYGKSIDYTVSGNRAHSSYSVNSDSLGGFHPQSYSLLESRVNYETTVRQSYSAGTPELIIEAPKTIIYDKSQGYSPKLHSKSDAYYKSEKHDLFAPEIFLSPNRKDVKFVKASEEVRALVEDAFHALTGKPLPNFNIRICTPAEMKKAHPNWHESIRGFAVPSTQSIFVLQAPLDELMVTLGHEIGHLLAKSASSEVDEEAKAFAFSVAWIQAIKERDIGGLGKNLVVPTPARNNIHDKAWEFVQQMLKSGENPIGLFYQLSSGYISNQHQNL